MFKQVEEFENEYDENYEDWCEITDRAFLKSLERNCDDEDYEE